MEFLDANEKTLVEKYRKLTVNEKKEVIDFLSFLNQREKIEKKGWDDIVGQA